MFNCLIWQKELKYCKLDNRGPWAESQMTFLLFSLITKYLRCKRGQLLSIVNLSLKFLYRLLNSGSVLKKKKKQLKIHTKNNCITFNSEYVLC